MASKFLERSVVIRELMPQDLKLEIDRLSREEAVNAARYLAEVVGKAHARQMDASTRRDFAATFNRRKTAQLNAPSWLWSTVVELASTHEAAYLEHCRRYAPRPLTQGAESRPRPACRLILTPFGAGATGSMRYHGGPRKYRPPIHE